MKKIGQYTFAFDRHIGIAGAASAVGVKEGEGPLAALFDYIADDDLMGQDAWEKAESQFQKKAVSLLLQKTAVNACDIDLICAGDLLGQSAGSTFGLKEFGMPHVGLYGACSTMSLSLCNSAAWIESGAQRAIAVTSSHFCSAEREFRFPLDYGSIRTPSTQWTVTGAGAVMLDTVSTPSIQEITLGRIVDPNQTDANNMGAAMAPAAADTVARYLRDTGKVPEDFDAIVTGDLGLVGSQLFCDLMKRDGFDIEKRHRDCGMMMFDIEQQDVHAGASGCGCSASVLCAYFLPRLKEGSLRNILFCATGALLSTTSTQQGQSIPGICHAVHICGKSKKQS